MGQKEEETDLLVVDVDSEELESGVRGCVRVALERRRDGFAAGFIVESVVGLRDEGGRIG